MSLSKYTVAVALSLLALQVHAETATSAAGAPVTLPMNQVQQLGAALTATGTFNADMASTTIAATGALATNSLAEASVTSSGSEPGTYVLLAAALAAMGFVARRRQP